MRSRYRSGCGLWLSCEVPPWSNHRMGPVVESCTPLIWQPHDPHGWSETSRKRLGVVVARLQVGRTFVAPATHVFAS